MKVWAKNKLSFVTIVTHFLSYILDTFVINTLFFALFPAFCAKVEKNIVPLHTNLNKTTF